MSLQTHNPMPMDDDQLLREYASVRSESAFAELVSRHGDWVYSAALRSVGDSHSAQDVTQAVFLLLAQDPQKAVGKSLSGWLFNVMRYCVINAKRSERRRKRHEREAAEMTPPAQQAPDEPLWKELAPRLEDSMARLRAKDREVLLSRFYEGKTMSQIGAQLGISEDAARKRVSAALEKLRALFQSAGVAAGTPALATTLKSKVTRPAPLALMAILKAQSATKIPAIVSLANTARRMLWLAKAKAAVTVAVVAVSIPLATATAVIVAKKVVAPPQTPLAAPLQMAPAIPAPPVVGPAPTTVQYPETVAFELGSSKFLPGDNITITEVRGTSNMIEAGNVYQIKGTYRLSSQNGVSLQSHITTEQPIGVQEFPDQRQDIKRGQGTFTLPLNVPVGGSPHVSFYVGKTIIGGVYFGTGNYVYRSPL
jgi:RNA polymerase sigma factor (sigma-70 family)